MSSNERCPLCWTPIGPEAIYDMAVIQHLVNTHKRTLEQANELLLLHKQGTIGSNKPPVPSLDFTGINYDGVRCDGNTLIITVEGGVVTIQCNGAISITLK